MASKERTKDLSQNYLQTISQPLDYMFSPKSVAIIGAKDDPGSVAKTIISNLKKGDFSLFPVNPKRTQVLGLPSYPNIASVPSPVDLALIVTPAMTVPAIIAECVEAHVKSAVIISAGFKELGAAGIKLEDQIRQYSKNAAMPILGPNCLGIMNPVSGLNATFAKQMANTGNVAFISQSGALCTAVLDWSFQEKIGFSAFVSVGSMIDVAWGDLISYFGSDPHTQSILLYMETVGDPRAFLSAAREIAPTKPIVVIKPGRTEAARHAAASHTGSFAGNDAVFDASLERVGILRVDTISELFDMAEVLAKQPLPKGPNLAIITNAGGPAVLATDAAIQNGASVPPLSDKTKEKLHSFLPPAWSHNNPIDILGDAKSLTFDLTIKAVLEAQEFDGILTILTPQDMTEPLETAKSLAKYSSDKPILASWMGAESVQSGIKVLNEGGICTFEFPDEAATAFAMMWRYHENLRTLYEIPAAVEITGLTGPGAYEKQLERMEKAKLFCLSDKKILNEEDSKALLSFYGIPVVQTLKAKTVEEAVTIAKKLGFPVVLKLRSSTITHKSDVGGVRLNLQSEREVEAAFEAIKGAVGPEAFDGVTVQKMIPFRGIELILGSTVDQQFGPVILFGEGGEMVEIHRDTALGLPPLGTIHALRLMQRTKIYKTLEGYRGRAPVDKEKLIRILINFSQMIIENPWIAECDINPLLASREAIVALDARIAIGKGESVKAAIRPYPLEYCSQWVLKNGARVVIRPIKAQDYQMMEVFHKKLSKYSSQTGKRLTQLCMNDFTREYVLVALHCDEERIVGIIRLSRIPFTPHAQLFMVIEEAFQNIGLGTHLMDRIIEIARKEGIRKIIAKILPENKGMLFLCAHFGFKLEPEEDFFLAEWHPNEVGREPYDT